MDGSNISFAPAALAPGAHKARPLIVIRERRTATASQFHAADQTTAAALRSRALMAEASTRVLYVTSAVAGEGVSTVARELAHAVSCMPGCNTLLLDANPGGHDQARALGGTLPDIVSGYEARGGLDVIAFGSANASFHAARWPMATSSPALRPLSALLRGVYHLIVVDCPPILSHPHLPDIAGGSQQVLLVIRSEVSSVRLVRRAKREIERLRGTVWGAVLAGQRQVLPRGFDRWF